jgi:hypothetical protein
MTMTAALPAFMLLGTLTFYMMSICVHIYCLIFLQKRYVISNFICKYYLGGSVYALRGFLLPKPIQKLGGIPKLRIALAEVCSVLVT